jgi:tRNA (guanine37-N1)-methyltransferase
MIVDRTLFDGRTLLKAARVRCRDVGKILKHPSASEFVWSKPGQKSVYPCPTDPANFRLVLTKSEIPTGKLEDVDLTMTEFELKSSYDDLRTDEVLRRLLPDFADPPSSFETVGHIAHMNLRDEFLPHKELIGQVILDKNPNIETVVTKIGTLSNEFRTFDMEIIACRNNNRSLVATVSEHKMRLRIDYEKCYWNSRLSTERSRLLSMFTATDPGQSRLIDMCCGVGALACFAAREGVEVFANDLNPSATACARQNALTNKVEVAVFNMDAREFVRKLIADGKLDVPKINHVMVNLPEIGIEFLDVFAGLLDRTDGNEFRIYCHCFSREKPPKDLRGRIPLALPDD